MEEQLTFQFVENGLKNIRSAFSDIEEDLEDVQERGENVQEAFDDLQRRFDVDRIQDGLQGVVDDLELVQDTTDDIEFRRLNREDFNPLSGRLEDLRGQLQKLETPRDIQVDTNLNRVEGDVEAVSRDLRGARSDAERFASSLTSLSSIDSLIDFDPGELQVGIQDAIEAAVGGGGQGAGGSPNVNVDGGGGLLGGAGLALGAKYGGDFAEGAKREISRRLEASRNRETAEKFFDADFDLDFLDKIFDKVRDFSNDSIFSELIGKFGSLLAIAKKIPGPVGGIAAALATVAAGATAAGAAVAALVQKFGGEAQQFRVAEAQGGVSTERISRLLEAAQALDSTVDVDTIRDAFKELAIRSQDAIEGAGEARQGFERLGISIEELKQLNPAELFTRIQKPLRELSTAQRTLTLEQLAGGEAGEKLIRIFSLQAAEFEKLKDITSETAATQAQIEILDNLKFRLNLVSNKFDALGRQIATQFGPTVVTVIETFTAVIVELGEGISNILSSFEVGGISPFGPTSPLRFLEVFFSPDVDLDAIRNPPPLPVPKFEKAPLEKQLIDFGTVEFPTQLDIQYQLAEDVERPEAAAVRLLEDEDVFDQVKDLTLAQPDFSKVLARLQKDVNVFADSLRDVLVGTLSRSIDSAFDTIGEFFVESFSALFQRGTSDALSANRARLDLFNAKEQVRSLRNALAEGSLSYREFALRIRNQQLRIQESQEELNEALDSGFVDALESLGDAASRIFKQLIADVVATIAKLAVLKAITSAFTFGADSFGGQVITALGGGGFLNSRAAPVGANATTPRSLQNSMNITISGQTRTDGRDLVTTFRSTQRAERRVGRA